MSTVLLRRTAGDFCIFRFDRNVYTLESDVTGVIAYFNTAAEAELRGHEMAKVACVRLWRASSAGVLTLAASFRQP